MDRIPHFPQLKDICYLDHAGATVPSSRQLEKHFRLLQSSVLGNPHSSVSEGSDYVEEARQRVLEFFGTSPGEYTVIFTSGATDSIRRVGECFSYGRSGILCYLDDNHTSVLGLREYALTKGAEVCCISHDQLHLVKPTVHSNITHKQASTYTKPAATAGLFVYPAQSNFSGRKYNLDWGAQLKGGTLSVGHACADWYIMLDAASLVATSPLCLSGSDIDFVPISFYKIFGYPTGLGALLVKNTSFHKLKKVYFGGGSVEGAGVDKFFHYPRHNKSHWFEDGTLPFQQIAALQFGLDELFTSGGGMKAISTHTYQLAKLAHDTLQSLEHFNGSKLVHIYCDSEFRDQRLQGPILAFNLIRSNGEHIGYNEVQTMAGLYKIHLRTGCFCNIGACQKLLGISTQQLHDNHQLGHRCGDSVDLINGQPTGAVRASFGYMSTIEDVQTLVRFIRECFCETLDQSYSVSSQVDAPVQEETRDITLCSLQLFPVKSCASYKVEDWPLSESGLLYDRAWAIIDSNDRCLTLKRNPDLRKIKPSIDLDRKQLILSAEGFDEQTVAINELHEEILCNRVHMQTCSVKICGKMVETLDCGKEASLWISDVLALTGCRLVRQLSNQSLANDSQYLLISRDSVESLCDYITDQMNCSAIVEEVAERFRANLMVSGCQPDEESKWSHIQIGQHMFKCIGECERCSLISIDYDTGEMTKEPLRSLTTRKGAKPTFGIHVVNTNFKQGRLKVGDVFHTVD